MAAVIYWRMLEMEGLHASFGNADVKVFVLQDLG